MRFLFAVLAATTMVLAAGPSSAQFEESKKAQGNGDGTFKATEVVFHVQSVGRNKHVVPKGAKAPPNPTNGPNQLFVYRNDLGFWALPPANSITTPYTGKAEYKWFNGTQHKDDLTYIAHGHVTDSGGFQLPAGTKVSTWAVMASDQQGNTIFFYFADSAVINAPQGRRYPMYYSWDAPTANPVIMRFITDDGTTRT